MFKNFDKHVFWRKFISFTSLIMNLKNKLFMLLICSSIMGYSQQGNYKFNNFGNRSILLTGNVTGSVSDLGLTYYNPSFLARVENVGFSLNAKAYQLVSLKLNNVLNEDAQLSNTSFNGASTMAGGIFNLFGTRFAYSYLTKSNFNYNLNYSSYFLNDNILTLFPDAELHYASIGLRSKVKDDWSGLTWAYEVNEKFSLGISAFVSIYGYKGGSDLNHFVQSTGNEVAFYQNIINFNQKSYGLFIKVGANYEFEKFNLGLNINIPYLEVYSDGSYGYSEVVAGVGSDYNKFIDIYFDDLKGKRKEPLGISIGAGIPINKSKLSLNIDYVSGMDGYDRLPIPDINTGNDELTAVNFIEERRTVVNFGVGGEVYLSDKFNAYGGFSTDFSAFKTSANIFDLSSTENKKINVGSDFYHMSLGVNWKLSWSNLIMGVTYSSSSKSFASPYIIDVEGFEIENTFDPVIRFTRWQFVVGIDVPILAKKVKSLIIKDKGDKDDTNTKEDPKE